MSITVRQEPALDLEGYSQVRMELTVRSRFRVEIVDGGLGGWTLNEEPVHPPFHKDYDEHWPPTEWVKFDLHHVGGGSSHPLLRIAIRSTDGKQLSRFKAMIEGG